MKKEYRFKCNPKEQEIVEAFEKEYLNGKGHTTLSGILSGWNNDSQTNPKKCLTEDEEQICLGLVQWLGSPVGQGFLESVGFVLKKSTNE